MWRVVWYVAIVVVHVWLARELAPAAGDVSHAFLGALVAGIGAVFGWLADKAVTLAVTMYHVTVLIGRHLWDFATRVAGVFRGVGQLLARFWASVLRPFVVNVWEGFLRLKRFLEETFGPILRFLESVRREILKFYEKWFRPIFDTIEILRRSLQILERLGLEWARELDAKLAELEGRLLAPIRFALLKINEAIEIVDRIMTLDGLIQRVTLIGSLIRYQADALKVWWQSIHKPLEGEKKSEYERPLETRPIATVAADYRAYVIDGGGPDATRIDEHARDYALRLRAIP